MLCARSEAVVVGGAGTKEAEEEELIRATLRPKQERECERLCSLSFVVLELATTHATLTRNLN